MLECRRVKDDGWLASVMLLMRLCKLNAALLHGAERARPWRPAPMVAVRTCDAGSIRRVAARTAERIEVAPMLHVVVASLNEC